MEHLETEVKFYLPDVNLIRERILSLGATSQGRVFESNIRFEDLNNSLRQKNFLLRLRKDDKSRLTFKSKPIEKDNQVKIRKELEVEVSDFSTMLHILESLGFHKEQIYEKWRETLILENTIFCMDTMPFGEFLEIEGEKERIITFAYALGLKWEKRILMNYLRIFGIIKKHTNLFFSDITFDNFNGIGIDLPAYLPLIEVGKV